MWTCWKKFTFFWNISAYNNLSFWNNQNAALTHTHTLTYGGKRGEKSDEQAIELCVLLVRLRNVCKCACVIFISKQMKNQSTIRLHVHSFSHFLTHSLFIAHPSKNKWTHTQIKDKKPISQIIIIVWEAHIAISRFALVSPRARKSVLLAHSRPFSNIIEF